MTILKNIIDWIREFVNSDIGIILSFIALVSWLYGVAKFYSKKFGANSNTIKGASIIAIILSLGLVIPVIVLIFSDWSTVLKVILNILAIFCVGNFVLLLYIIKKMVFNKEINSNRQEEEATVRLRSTHVFFNGDLNIFLAEENFFGNPLEHKITAKIWTPGYEEIGVKKKGVGYSLMYASNTKYRIRITKAQINEATFQVTKM